MLQFALGLSYINISWLLGDALGLTVYNVPPLFFVAGIVFVFSRFYSFKLKGEAVRFLALIGALGVFAAALHGLTFWHFRQVLAYIVAATVWLFLYQEAGKRDIYSMQNTLVIMVCYGAYALLVITERAVLESGGLAYFVGSIFSFHPEAIDKYLFAAAGPRLSYFSNEPSAAAYAIGASVMPFVCANAALNRSPSSFAIFALAAILLYLAEGMTSQLLLLYSAAFVLVPRLSVLLVPVSMAAVAVGAIMLVPLLNDRAALFSFLFDTFGGIYGRIDIGLDSGSYLSRLGSWFIGAKTFLEAPIFGQGFGGSAANFFDLANSGLDVFFTSEQEDMYYGGIVPTNAQVVLRIPAELGLVGVGIFLVYGWRAFKHVFRRAEGDRMSYFAFLYALGAMLLSFNLSGEYANPMICAFVALLVQMLRKRHEADQTARVTDSPTTSAAPAPSGNA